MLHGQFLKGEQAEPLLALFAICCPFGPLPLLDVPPRDYTFKSKHKMDLAPLSMDHRFVNLAFTTSFTAFYKTLQPIRGV